MSGFHLKTRFILYTNSNICCFKIHELDVKNRTRKTIREIYQIKLILKAIRSGRTTPPLVSDIITNNEEV